MTVMADADRARTILHVDMDAFYASVEQLRRPELRGKPVIVGGPGARGVVAAASYEARVYGIHSAMSSTQAQRLCPHAVFVAGDHEHYGEISQRVMDAFRSFTPLVEAISLDEAFLDVTGAQRLHGDGPTIAAKVRAAVWEQEQLTCSVGVASTKHVAKLASEAAKPRIGRHGPEPGLGVKVVEPDGVLEFLHPLPVQALWGVGPKTLEKLHRLGIDTVGDLAGLDERAAQAAMGAANGTHLHQLALGIDDRDVIPHQKAKSIGHEETFAHDHHTYDTLQPQVVRLGDSVAQRLRAAGMAGRTVTIKVRFHDFRTITRSVTLSSAIDTGPDVVRAAGELLRKIDPTPGVRLFGIHVSQLSDGAARQLSLEDVEAPSWDDATGAIDAIRSRFGHDAIVPASLTGPDGIRVKKRGDQQWGPTDGRVQPDDGGSSSTTAPGTKPKRS
jgi:DNA polymerase-4